MDQLEPKFNDSIFPKNEPQRAEIIGFTYKSNLIDPVIWKLEINLIED